MSGDTLTLVGIAEGTAAVTVTATDPDGLTAAQGFQVTVESARSGFQIDLAFATPVTRTQEAAFVRAAARWMKVLAPTKLGDFRHLWWSCWDDQRFERYAAIDDVLIVAAVEEIDGQGGTVASVGPGIWDGHWRETVLNAELMTAWTEEGVPEPMSAITIQSLADMGYAVDLTAADPYRLPEVDADHAQESARLIHYGDDIWRVPMIVADRAGRIVRVIPGPRSDRSR